MPQRQLVRGLALWLFVLGTTGFHDDDCELASKAEARSLDWGALRDSIVKGPVDEKLLQVLRDRRGDSRLAAECALGVAVGCLIDAGPDEAAACIAGIPIVRLLATRWRIFRLLGQLQRRVNGDVANCDDVEHPSLDWAHWRATSEAFGQVVPLWLNGLSGSEVAPQEYNDGVSEAHGIIWKASSNAVAGERTIAQWTSHCAFGVISAHAVRAVGMVLGDGDVYRIVERAVQSSELLLNHTTEVLHSKWRIFDILDTLSLLKRTRHDHRLYPKDLRPLPGPPSEAARSDTWRAAAAALRRAGATTVLGEARTIMMTGLPDSRVNHLMNVFKHAKRLGFLAPLAVVPYRSNGTAACEVVVDLFAMKRAWDVPPDWAPCLPFITEFPDRAQFLYLHLALQLGLLVLWFDLHIVFFRPPLPWLRDLVTGPHRPPRYYHDCRAQCANVEEPEAFMAEEFYARHWPKTTLMVLRPTEAVKRWLEVLTRWICTFPYASVKRGIRYMAHPDQPDAVPSISALPSPDGVPRVVVGELDVEQEFITFDGWFGEYDKIMAYEVSSFVREEDRIMLLDQLLSGKEGEIRRIVGISRKSISPLRPTQRLYKTHAAEISAAAECSWLHIPGVFIGGYADDDESEFSSVSAAQCACKLLGSGCRGITCDGATSGMSCTLRKGDPELVTSPFGEDSYVKDCVSGSGCDAPPIDRIVHVNFADGCCQAEQQQSSETSLQFGATESRPLRGDFLDTAFREKNHHLLTFNRTPELTQHKTPSGKIGYYVWKPYVILRTIQDESLPWDTTVIAYTDAGVHFVDDMRPLIHRYLRGSDVAATRTPMLEGDFSKRDAFILLDADYQTIMETNQIATGLILVRKTPLAIKFLERWLYACEDPRVMTEEPSVLGIPDYFSFRNNNDDQTAFSLLFKRFGFTPFSVGERDAVVYTGRNLAKFIKASDDFALGIQSDREAYLQAADDAAKQHSASI